MKNHYSLFHSSQFPFKFINQFYTFQIGETILHENQFDFSLFGEMVDLPQWAKIMTPRPIMDSYYFPFNPIERARHPKLSPHNWPTNSDTEPISHCNNSLLTNFVENPKIKDLQGNDLMFDF